MSREDCVEFRCQVGKGDLMQVESGFDNEDHIGFEMIESVLNGAGNCITIVLNRAQVEKLTEHLLIALDEF